MVHKLHWTPEEKNAAQSQGILNAIKENGKAIAQSTEARAADEAYTQELLEEIREKEFPKEIKTEIIGKRDEIASAFFSMLRGDKGEPGHTPTDQELLELITPLIPEPIPGEDGHTPTDEELLALIRPLIPNIKQPKDGKTPTEQELLSLIRPLIPTSVEGKPGKPGKDGSPDTPDEVVEKVNQSEKKIDSKRVQGLDDVIQTVDNIGKFQSSGRGGGRAPLLIQGAGAKLSDHVTTLNFSTNLTAVYSGNGVVTITGAAGYTNLTEFVGQTAWRVFYSDGSGDVKELALGADGTFLKSNGASSAPTFATPAGSGDVSKVGTPVNNQVGVWTGDGTLEGDADLTFDTTTNVLSSGGFLGTGLTASEIVITDGSKNLVSAAVATYPSLTELTYVKGVTSSIQTQLNTKVDTANSPNANEFARFTDADTIEGRTASETRSDLSLGSAALVATDLADLNEATIETAIDTLANLTSIQGRTVTLADAGANAIFGWDDVAGAYENLTQAEVKAVIGTASDTATGVVELATDAETTTGTDTTRAITPANLTSQIGSRIQAYDADLTTWAGLTPSANAQSLVTAANYAAMRTLLDLEAGTDFYSIAATDSAIDADVATHAALTATHGVSGALVGTTDTQTLSSKTLTAPVINASTQTGNQNIAALPATDHTANGPTTSIFNLGATVALMDLVYLGSGGKWLLTDADAAATAQGMLGICLDGGDDTDTTTVALPGSFIRDDTWNWTVGAKLFVSTTPGGITETAPTGEDDVVRRIGWATSADTIYFMPGDEGTYTV